MLWCGALRCCVQQWAWDGRQSPQRAPHISTTAGLPATTEVVQHWGYCAPLRVAKLLKDASDASPSGLDSSLPVCDAGCGSGLSGLALREEGISAPLVGFDVSSEMLRLCKEKGVYQSVTGWWVRKIWYSYCAIMPLHCPYMSFQSAKWQGHSFQSLGVDGFCPFSSIFRMLFVFVFCSFDNLLICSFASYQMLSVYLIANCVANLFDVWIVFCP